MKATEIIKKLQELVAEYGDKDVEMMQESKISGRFVQVQSEVKDLAAASKYFVIIGQELI